MTMRFINQQKQCAYWWQRVCGTAFVMACALCICACAGATRPTDATGPRANEPPYPVLLTASEDRSQAARATWLALAKAQGIANPSVPDIDPVTGTIRKLPALPADANVHLPKVGVQATMSEEETRESLRRFIANETRLIGATPQQLSLVSLTSTGRNTQTARYQQRPFRYELRGDYGVLQIEFAPDGKLLQLSSTCIPEIENLQRAITGLRPRYSAEEVAKRLVGRSIAIANGETNSVTDGSNANINSAINSSVNKSAVDNQAGYTIAAGDDVQVRELVVYPRPHMADPNALEFHLAWEIEIARGAEKQMVYLDAITDEFIAAERAT